MFKLTLQIFLGMALAMQLSGCFFADRDHRDHGDRMEHHDHDPAVDVRIH